MRARWIVEEIIKASDRLIYDACVGEHMIKPTVRMLHALEKDLLTPELRVIIAQKEVGLIGYKFVQNRRTPRDTKLHMADIGLEIGHAILQLKMLALDLGLVPEECEKMGLTSTWDRFKDFWPNEVK